MMKTTALVAIFVVALIGIGVSMPIHVCTPEQAAKIFMQPSRDEIAAIHTDLMNGLLTEQQAITMFYELKARLGVKKVLLEAIRDSEIMTYSQKLEALFAVFPWNVR